MAKGVVCCTFSYECGSNIDGTAMICSETKCTEVEYEDESSGGGNITIALQYPSSLFQNLAKDVIATIIKGQSTLAAKPRTRTVKVKPTGKLLTATKQSAALSRLQGKATR